MAGEYTVKILGSEDFNRLPFKRIRENPTHIYGAADKKNRIAYVRDTGYGDFTKATIGHELDELLNNVSEHEEEGIRYKDFSQSFSNFGSSIPAIGKVAGPVLGAFGQVPDLLGSGISSLGRGIKNVLTPNPGTPTAKTVLPGLGTGSGATSPAMSTTINKGISGALAGRQPTSYFPQMSSTKMSLPQVSLPDFSIGAQKMPVQDVVKKSATDTGAMSIWDQLKGAAPGTAVSMLGNLFAPRVTTPDFSGIRADLERRIGAGGSPAYDLGFGEAKRILGADFGTVPQEMYDEIDLRRNEEIRALEDRFRANQQSGGMSESDTSQFGRLRAQIVDQYERMKSQLAFDYRQQQEANRIQTMQTVLNLDQAQFEQYAQLAQIDTYELMMKTGLDAQTAQDFKELFGNIGGRMIQGALDRTATA